MSWSGRSDRNRGTLYRTGHYEKKEGFSIKENRRAIQQQLRKYRGSGKGRRARSGGFSYSEPNQRARYQSYFQYRRPAPYATSSSSESDSYESDTSSDSEWTNPPGTLLDLVKYDGRPMWNVQGSSSCKCFQDPDSEYYPPSWIEICEMVTKRERGRCSFKDCSNKASVGGHLQYAVGKGHRIWYLAPICSSCNHITMDDKAGLLRQYTRMVKVQCACTTY
jgi:hypothetical protein